jgi:hypothetical protein
MASKARAIIVSHLVDPGSLSIRKTMIKSAKSVDGRSVTILCGEYNAKNRLGGFVGFRSFVYEPAVMKGVLSFDDSLALDFMSADGSGDLSHDPGGAIQAGADPGKLVALHQKATDFAIQYLPVCLGAT